MKISSTLRNTLMAVGALAMFSAPAGVYGYYNHDNDQQKAATVNYITGGIGDDERDAMESARHQYNLHVTSADRSGAYMGDTTLSIYDRSGNRVLSTDAGPLFYAELPPGKYTLQAVSEGQQQKKTVNVNRDGASNVSLIWN